MESVDRPPVDTPVPVHDALGPLHELAAELVMHGDFRKEVFAGLGDLLLQQPDSRVLVQNRRRDPFGSRDFLAKDLGLRQSIGL